jgi:hypothetical protein
MGNDDDSNGTRDTAGFGGAFVRRLIPTVAAASLSFTGCLPSGGGNNGQGGSQDGGTSDSGEVDGFAGDTGSNVQTGLVNVNGDGQLQTLELTRFCRAWSQCDPAYFNETYGSVSQCAWTIEEEFEYYASNYGDAYGEECEEAWRAFAECQIGATACLNGEIYPGYGGECYDSAPYYGGCYGY